MFRLVFQQFTIPNVCLKSFAFLVDHTGCQRFFFPAVQSRATISQLPSYKCGQATRKMAWCHISRIHQGQARDALLRAHCFHDVPQRCLPLGHTRSTLVLQRSKVVAGHAYVVRYVVIRTSSTPWSIIYRRCLWERRLAVSAKTSKEVWNKGGLLTYIWSTSR
jgi:hypothetical protein